MGSSIETAVISRTMHLMGFVGVLLVVLPAFTLCSEDAIDCGPDMVSCPGLADYCSGQGYSYFGVQFRHECFCGNTAPPRSRLATGCNYACPGNNRRTCGGTWRMNVYFV